MYKDVDKLWQLHSGCEHVCQYCYAKGGLKSVLDIKELRDTNLNLKRPVKIFVDYKSDLFAHSVPELEIKIVLLKCSKSPQNTYIFQSKNPNRALEFKNLFPPLFLMGTTIETNRQDYLDSLSKAPPVIDRANAIKEFAPNNFVTIEPILDFDLPQMMELIISAKPSKIYVGADSKFRVQKELKKKLFEPSKENIESLLQALKLEGFEVIKKFNLERLQK